MKRIVFLLPKPSLTPAGGYKVAFEYANMLANDGYSVSIVYASTFSKCNTVREFYNSIKNYVKYFLLNCKVVKNWFELDSRISKRIVYRISDCFLPKSDIYIATSVETAIDLERICIPCHKMYLIQHYESWITSEDKLIQTYSNGMTKIVISRWLYNIVSQYSNNCTLIPNGFDFSAFNTMLIPQKRNPFSIAMLYHNIDWKGCADCFSALEIVKNKYPEVQVTLFGVPQRPDFLPEWYHYFQTPDRVMLNSIYNNSAIFIGASWSEGWGLTVGEAMICSCAVACTDNDGYKEMAIHESTALLSPIKRPDALANNIVRLIEDNQLRLSLSQNGNRYIQEFTWERAYSRFKQLIENQ